MKRESQNDRILAVLRHANWYALTAHGNDGHRWLTTAEIHRRAGFSRLNSRIAELRKRGYLIECRRIEGAAPGPDAQEYRLYETAA